VTDPIATREEVMAILSAAARAGSVTACRVLLEELRRSEVSTQTDTIIDELARRRTEVTIA
jgi:hypothetical protein